MDTFFAVDPINLLLVVIAITVFVAFACEGRSKSEAREHSGIAPKLKFSKDVPNKR